jgi:hypothetical protein
MVKESCARVLRCRVERESSRHIPSAVGAFEIDSVVFESVKEVEDVKKIGGLSSKLG